MEKKIQLKEQENGSIITIKSTGITVKDCLEAKHIADWLKKNKADVAKIIDVKLTVCLELLQVTLPDHVIEAFIDDIIEVYKSESLEDIILCLQNGRRGMYGQNYGKFNMIVFTEWMREHLYEKAGLREAKIYEGDSAHNWESRGDYLESIKTGDEIQKAVKKIEQKRKHKIHEDEMGEHNYQKFKGEYIKKQSEAGEK